MNKIISIIAAALGIAILVVVFVAVNRPINVDVNVPEQPIEYGTSPDIMSKYLCVGGVCKFTGRSSTLASASTTPCALQSPAATSTLSFFSVHLSTSTTTAGIFDIGKSATDKTSTTTRLTTVNTFAANDTIDFYLTSSTTPISSAVHQFMFPPNTWLVFKMAGGITAGTYSPVGSCQAEWIRLN